MCVLSCVQPFVTPWTVVQQAPQSKEFSRQDYWSGLPFPSPGDVPDPGIKPKSPVLQADSLTSEPSRSQHHQPSGLTGLESTCLWAAYHNFSHTWAFQNLQNSSKILLCVSIDGETEPCPTVASDNFILPGPIASHFSN